MVNSADCPRGLGLDSQHPHGGSLLPVTVASGDPTPSSGFHRYCTHGTQTYLQAKHPYTQTVCAPPIHKVEKKGKLLLEEAGVGEDGSL